MTQAAEDAQGPKPDRAHRDGRCVEDGRAFAQPRDRAADDVGVALHGAAQGRPGLGGGPMQHQNNTARGRTLGCLAQKLDSLIWNHLTPLHTELGLGQGLDLDEKM